MIHILIFNSYYLYMDYQGIVTLEFQKQTNPRIITQLFFFNS